MGTKLSESIGGLESGWLGETQTQKHQDLASVAEQAAADMGTDADPEVRGLPGPAL